MLSDSSKSALEMASEDLKKNIVKKHEKYEIVRLFSDLRGPNYQSYQLFEATFR